MKALPVLLLSMLACWAWAQEGVVGMAAHPVTTADLNPKLRTSVKPGRGRAVSACDGVIEYRMMDNNGHVHVRYYDNATAQLLCSKNSIDPIDCSRYWKCS